MRVQCGMGWSDEVSDEEKERDEVRVMMEMAGEGGTFCVGKERMGRDPLPLSPSPTISIITLAESRLIPPGLRNIIYIL